MKRCLLIIDVQNEYFTGKLPVSYPSESFANILRAMDEATAYGVPVVVIQHTSPFEQPVTFGRDTDTWQLHPEIAKRPRTHYLEKKLPSSFSGTDLHEWLQQNGIDTVTISGYMTQMCCDSTAKEAFHLGYQVEFLSDATGTLDVSNDAGSVTAEELHRAILVAQASRFSKVMSTAHWVRQIS